MKKNLFLVLAAGLLLAGCQEKQTPALSIDDITTFATISGTISYEMAVDTVPDAMLSMTVVKYDTLPLTNQTVEIKVDASQYSQNVWGIYKTFSAVTDSLGHFDIQVPVLANATNFAITEIALRPFYLNNYRVATPTYTYDPMTYTYKVIYNFTDGQVYFDGVLTTIMAPANIYAGRTYFLGNELITAISFVTVGL